MEYSLPGSSVPGILQARILGWVSISFPSGSSWPRNRTWVACIVGRFLPTEQHGKLCHSVIPLNFFCFWSLKSSLVAQMVKHLPTMQETWVQSLGWEDPLEKEVATHSSTLGRKIPWVEERDRLQSMRSESQTQLSDFTFFHFWSLPVWLNIMTPVFTGYCVMCFYSFILLVCL